MFKNIQPQKIIIFSVIIFFILSSAWLFAVSEKYLDPNYAAGWWSTSFVDPQGQDLSFTIENRGAKKDFNWELTDGKNSLQTGTIKISSGKTETVSIDVQDSANTKFSIIVHTDSEKKEIYKNF